MEDSQPVVRWGILGTGRISEKVGVAIRQAQGAELVAVASRTADRAADWGRRHEVSRTYAGYANLLADPDVDAVYLPLPPSLHREWTVRAAEAGKHVLCEKPLALNIAEAREMESACRSNAVQLMDGVMWLHHPRARDMQALIQNGTLGTLRRVTSAFTFNWDRLPENEFRLDRALGGGSLGDLGWYCIGASVWAFEERPNRVFATARFHNDVDVSLSAILWFGENRIASFDCGFNASIRKWFEVAGSDASLVCDDFTRPWHDDKPRCWVHGNEGKMSEHVSAAPIQEVCMINDFCDIVRSGRLDARWTQLAVDTQLICDALDRSARTGTPVDVPDS